jgi:PAS domain S-box-containing protein
MRTSAGPDLPEAMNHPLSLSQLTLLIGGAVVLGGLLVFMVYLVHKSFKERRESRTFAPTTERLPDEASFATAALQGVIATMKAQEKELVELRHAADRRARESARLSENVLREMPNGLMAFNREGFLTAANPAVRKLLGIDTWSRRRYPEILGRESALTRRLEECLEAGKTVAQETLEYRTPAGETRVLGLSLSPLHASNGELDGALCLLSDLTEVQRLQEQIRLKEHLAALGAMSAGIAHELKNSLATISGYAQMLRDANLSDEDRKFAQKIVNEIRNLTQVVTDFLSLSRPLSLAKEPVDLERLLRQVMDDFKQMEPYGKLSYLLEGDFAPVEGDEVLLRQAFSNLVRNCCQAMAGRETPGEIRICGEIVRKADRTLSGIHISDTGPGVAPEDREKIFLPFFTTKQEGSGLGLALVQKIVVAHNGTIALETLSPQGACFAIQLPLRQEAPAPQPPEESSPARES